jgi:hypothetical protein
MKAESFRIRKETFVRSQPAADDQQKELKNNLLTNTRNIGPAYTRGSRGNVIERIGRKSNRFLPG